MGHSLIHVERKLGVTWRGYFKAPNSPTGVNLKYPPENIDKTTKKKKKSWMLRKGQTFELDSWNGKNSQKR